MDDFIISYWYLIVALVASGVSFGISIKIDKVKYPFSTSIIFGIAWPFFLVAILTMFISSLWRK